MKYIIIAVIYLIIGACFTGIMVFAFGQVPDWREAIKMTLLWPWWIVKLFR